LPTPGYSLVVNSNQRGTTTITDDPDAYEEVTISSVDTTKAILLFSYTMNAPKPEHHTVSGELTNSTTLTFNIYSSDPPNPVSIT
jgi:hypothetical protein